MAINVGQLLAAQLVSVQPMSTPTQGAFYADYIYNYGKETDEEMYNIIKKLKTDRDAFHLTQDKFNLSYLGSQLNNLKDLSEYDEYEWLKKELETNKGKFQMIHEMVEKVYVFKPFDLKNYKSIMHIK